ncbi:hypothetical protein SDRG_16126 [Saprolegnia diclina VS20]|uniref:Uncharacterized protein n=1 Tax=Saprolegnia diclina (strain VS20) TaxID=1156394 RepID=T0PKZ6_SAPDV|nr:hypothetical protein SDRG_16126 [Saprolegnia diclina VS20]EQC26024.1 hypothetical protein SDRG_16126 [Saprolegnia diclina VS20]|eukprot:XP_008620545.1 hypothetical protein SDRG_16126 [Saprolegnia diclina VS20]
MNPDGRMLASPAMGADGPLPRLHQHHGMHMAPEYHRPQAQLDHRSSPHTSPSPSEQQQVYPLRRDDHADAYHAKPQYVDPTSPTAVWRARRHEELAAGYGRSPDEAARPYAPEPPTLYAPRPDPSSSMYYADWRQESSGHERASSRRRVEHALRSHARSYDELLLIISAIDEELLHMSSNSKMQYFDSAMDFQRTLESGCTSYRL